VSGSHEARSGNVRICRAHRQNIPQGAGQTVQLPDDQDIPFTEMIEQSLQFRAVPATPSGLLPKDALTPRRLEAEACAVVSCSLVETRA
jgi:hypothetical protein